MITEIVFLHIRKGQAAEYEQAFAIARPIVASMKGFIDLELKKCLEAESKYVLIIKWATLEDHTIGFRKHEKYQQWKQLLHHFYDPFPGVEHYKKVF